MGASGSTGRIAGTDGFGAGDVEAIAVDCIVGAAGGVRAGEVNAGVVCAAGGVKFGAGGVIGFGGGGLCETVSSFLVRVVLLLA